MGEGRMARDGGGEAQTDWSPPFLPDDESGGGRGDVRRPTVSWYVPLAGRALTLLAIGMLLFALFGGLLGVTTTRSKSSGGTIRVATPNPVVHIDSAVGAIRVVPIPVGDAAKANAVTVEAITEVRHLSPRLAQQNLDGARIAPKLGDNGEIYIDTQPDGQGDFLFERSTTATVYVPDGANVRLNLHFGVANIARLSGPLSIDVSGGVLNIDDTTLGDGSRIALSGGNASLNGVTLNGRADLTVNGGNISLNGALGTNTTLTVAVNGGNASLRLPLTTAARLDASADGGGLNVSSGWLGTINTTTTTGGSQQIAGYLSTETMTMNRITLKLNGGNISLRPQSTDSPRSAPATPVPPVPPVAPARP